MEARKTRANVCVVCVRPGFTPALKIQQRKQMGDEEARERMLLRVSRKCKLKPQWSIITYSLEDLVFIFICVCVYPQRPEKSV